MEARLEWLENPEIFQVNREAAHSDHAYFGNYADIEKKSEGSFMQCLNGAWKFSYSENPSGRIADFYKEDYSTAAWNDITVPGHIQLAYRIAPTEEKPIGERYDRCQYINTMYPWDGQEFLRPPHISKEYNPVGSYVTYFDLDEAVKGQDSIYVSFQGVETAMYLWLNGEFVGYAEDGFTPSNFNITDIVREKGNKLAVEVYKRSSASWIEDQDFFRFSGIFRDVFLYAEPRLHAKDIFVRADFEDESRGGRLAVDIALSGSFTEVPCDSAAYAGGLAKCILKDSGGGVVFEDVKQISGAGIYFSADLAAVNPWSSEQPYLYELFIELYAGTSMVEVSRLNVGFRTFAMKNGIMCLNGKRIIFKGINRHEFSCERGRNITREEMLFDIHFMKRHNINAVRTCHYPNNSYWYRLCDEYGIYLIDETNLESHGSWQKLGACEPSWNVPGSLPEWREAVLDRAKNMLERDKNHPSVLIWSCGNESYAGDDIAAMSAYFHERDNTRLVHYEGVFWNRDYDYISDMESRMYAKPAEIEEYLKQNTGKPYISCEYMHAMGNSCGGMKLYTDLEDKYEAYQGGFVWDYIDQCLYRVREDGSRVLAYGGDFDDRASDYGFCTNGIVYADRGISPKAAEVKQLYSNVKIHIADGIVTVKNDSLFTDTSDYGFHVSLLADGAVREEYDRKFIVPPCGKDSFAVSFCKPTEQGEYTYQVSMVTARENVWAEAGYELVFGQEVFCVDGAEENRRERIYDTYAVGVETEPEKTRVIYGDVCIGVKGKHFYAQFNKSEGGISSLVIDGKEMITRVPKVSFWRARTDNDEGCKIQYVARNMEKLNKAEGDTEINVGMGQWLAASQCAVCNPSDITVREEEDRVSISFPYITAAIPRVRYDVIYEVHFDGRIFVTVDYPGYLGDFGPADNFEGGGPMADMPLLAMDFKMKRSFGRALYYGMGPEENYIDRDNGARLGRFETEPVANFPAYVRPQECGNRTGIRTVRLEDAEGTGVSFTAVDEPFEMSVLPYSVYELESALHIEELPDSEYVWVRIIAKQMGVGGDDSWGAPVHREYMLNGNEKRRLRFIIS